MPVVLYKVCETWSHILKDKRRLRVLENRVLRSILCPERAEIKGEWRRLQNEKLYALYASLNIIRVISQEDKMGKAYNTCGGGER